MGLKYNASGCRDETAEIAISRTYNEKKVKKKYSKLLKEVFASCEKYGFYVEGRITFVDKKTGKTFE